MRARRRPRPRPYAAHLTAFSPPVFACTRVNVSSCRSSNDDHPRSQSRRTALRHLATLALSLSVSGISVPCRVRADVAGDDAALANYPALRFGRQVVLPRWMDPDKDAGEEATDTKDAAPPEHEGQLHVEVGPGKSRTEIASALLARSGVVGFVAAFSMFGMAVSDRESGRVALPEKYDPRLVERYFRIRPDRVLARLAQFAVEGSRLAALRARHAIEAVTSDRYVSDDVRAKRRIARRAERAAALRESVSRLGPAVIKLGQAAATRPDVFGAEFVRELQKLQDDVVTPYPVGEAFALMRSEIGARPEAVFDTIDEKPVAGASLGMVFRAVVDGEPVAVKVQRPRVAESIALDFFIVRCFVGALQRAFGYQTDLQQAVDEYASQMFEELDYRNEVAHTLKFQELYGDTKGVFIPKPYEKYSTRKVLVTEWVDGHKIIDEDSKVKVEELGVVETGIQFALTQLLEKGFLHADMHNGNMLSTPSGDLAYIDFGIVSEIPRSVRESMVIALFYLIHGEYTALAETFVGLALMRPDEIEAELPQVAAALEEAFANSSEMDPNSGVVCDPLSPVVCRFTLIGVAEKVLQLGAQFPLVFNSYFLNSLRCLGMLEGLALNADPKFSVLNVVYPFIMRKILAGSPGTLYREALQRVLISSEGTLNWAKLDAMLREVQRSESAGVIQQAEKKRRRTARGTAKEPLDELLLSSKGKFLRAQIMKEWSQAHGGNGAGGLPRPRDVFRRASVAGKVRAMCVFLPALIVRAFLRVFFALFRGLAALFGRRRHKSQSESAEEVEGAKASGSQ